MQGKTALKNNLPATFSETRSTSLDIDFKNANTHQQQVNEQPLSRKAINSVTTGINNNSIQPGHHFNNMSIYAKPQPVIQAKLTVNKPGDEFEVEADAVAEKIMNLHGKPAEKKNDDSGNISGGITPLLQTKANATGTTISPELNNTIMDSKGRGSSIDSNTQSLMSKNFGADFSQVKIHADNEAAEMNNEISARAFTTGHDVYFNKGEYQPASAKGKHLLAHELTHVLQQTGGSQRIQRDEADDEKKAAAAEAKKKAGLITKIKSYGVIAVEDGDATFSSAELELVNKAIAGLPKGDKTAIAGAKIIRVSSLGGKTAGMYSNTQGYDSTANDEQKIELADKAFGSTTAEESIRLITHEIGHAIAAKPYRVAMSEEVKAGAKWNKLVDEANVAVDEFNTANDDSNNAITEFEAASEALTEAKSSGDKDAIAAATKDKAAKKRTMDKLKADRTKKESVFNTKKAASETQKTVLTTKETATKTKIANIDDLKTDASTKLTAMETAYTGASATINMTDPDSADYRASLTAAETAIKTFYDENVTVDVDEPTASAAKSVVDSAIRERDSKRDALNKANAGNAVTGATNALEQAQDSCYKAAIVVAFNKSMNLAVKKFYDFVITNAISPALTPYAEENWPHKPEEFYAEAYSFFVTKPKDLEAHSKLLYDWFKAGNYK